MARKQGEPILIEWVDSMGSSGWRELGKTDIRCQTVGMYHSEDKEKIAVALNKSAYGYGDYMEIPKVAVKRVKRLKI